VFLSFALVGLVAASLAATPRARAAQTNTLEALREALRPPPGVWGEVRVGTASRAQVDPRAVAMGEKFRQILGRPQPAPAVPAAAPAAPAAAPAAPAAAPAAAPPAADQQEAIRLLRERAGAEVEVHLRPGNQTVMQIRGGVLERPGRPVAQASEQDRLEQTARSFLRANRALLRLDDPDREWKLEGQQRDATGERHLRFAQVYQNLPVWPAGLSVHLDARGNVTLVDGAYVPTPAGVPVNPTLTADEAKARAKASVPEGEAASTTAPELIVYAPLDQPPRLAWKFDVSAGILQAWSFVVDALDGRVLSRVTRLCDVNVPGSGKDLEGATRNFNVWSQDNKFFLADTTKPMFQAGSNPVSDPKGVISIFDAREVTDRELKTVFLIESTGANNWLADGVSAMVNFGLTYDYFLERHNRNSLDGQGGNVQAVVRVAQMDNAFWNGNLKMMFFGNVRPYPAALDVVGHELAHGVTQHAADLVYELQPGAMNESFSDIFGEMVEARTEGRPDWKMGTRLGKVFRDMKDPGSIQISGLNRPYPSKMSEFVELPNSNDGDHGGVHINSSILNHCFYLLAEGLPGAVGLLDAERIFYRGLTQHLQKQSQFIDARLGCLAAAEALFGAGSPQAKKTAEAFDAVEIFATPPTPAPSPIPTVPGEDSTLLVTLDPFSDLIALGRREAALGDPVDGIALAEPVKEARPAVSGDGALAVFVNDFADVCAVETSNPLSVQCLGAEGTVHSVAVSPDGVQVAFVLLDPFTGQPDNRISIYSFTTQQTKTYNLLAPVADGNPADVVLFADAMVFTSDGKYLIYDAISEIRFGGGQPVQRWSIFRINLSTDSTTVLVPPLEAADFGNPNIGRAGNRYLTFDARNSQTGNDLILSLDLFTGDFAQVGDAGTGLGFPCFTGDESAIIYTAPDANAIFTGFSLVKQDLTPNRLGTTGQPTLWLPDAKIGVIYRRGTFVGANQPPTVTLTAPADNSSFPPPARITITAEASDADGMVAKVEFYDGANKLGEKASRPYTFEWANVPAGDYRILARAIDNLGAATDSTAADVTVGQATGPIRLAAARTATTIRVTVTSSPGNYTLERSPDLRTWTPQPLTIGAAGNVVVEDTLAGATRQFYRVKRN
jgi:Zn-dependent metalloprotease